MSTKVTVMLVPFRNGYDLRVFNSPKLANNLKITEPNSVISYDVPVEDYLDFEVDENFVEAIEADALQITEYQAEAKRFIEATRMLIESADDLTDYNDRIDVVQEIAQLIKNETHYRNGEIN